MPPITRLTLIEKLQAGTGWGEFVDLYAPLIFRFARRNGCDEHAAADLGSLVMEAVFKRVAKYDPVKYRFHVWLYLQAREQLRTLRFGDARNPAKGSGSDDVQEQLSEQPDSHWMSDWNRRLHELAEDAVRTENPVHFDIYERFNRRGQTAKQIEEETGRNANTVSGLAKRVQEKIEERFGELWREWGDEEGS